MINNRELSWLCFNKRVMQEAQDQTVPLLQRLRFLGIFSNNQDEFIKVRVGNLVRFSRMGKKAPIMTGNYHPSNLLAIVNKKIIDDFQLFQKTYDEILLEMEKNNIYVLNETELNKEQQAFCRNYYLNVISPRIVPLMVRKTAPLPFLKDGHVYMAIKMWIGRISRFSIIQLPISKKSPRFVVLPPSKKDRHEVIFLDDIIRLCLDEIFFMFRYEKVTAHTFKILRDAVMPLDEDLSLSTIEKMERGIEARQHGEVIRMIIDKKMPTDIIRTIANKLGLKETSDFIQHSTRYHLMKDLMKFPVLVSELENKGQHTSGHPYIRPNHSIMKVIKQHDIMLNYPYQSFSHFIDFLREAAVDPNVQNIYITLYRVAERSKVINALVNAARNGKHVVALVELLARFDEEQNVENIDILQDAGVKVIHGVDGLKVHSKICLIQRYEAGFLKGYTYVGTGNFNEDTARIYGDLGLLTFDQSIAEDASKVFEFLQHPHYHFNCKKLIVSPYSMREAFNDLIEREIEFALKGKKAYIYAKCNSLTDEDIIKRLYKASESGVKIRLQIRGACCLQPELAGISETIKVHSIVDKYLEHARLFIFHNGGEDETIISSADWMTRNLNRRVEVAVPITDKRIKKTLHKFFDIQWNDNVKSRTMFDFESNNYVEPKKNSYQIRAQLALHNFYEDLDQKHRKK
ncbi:MAG TPA: polyphosphate kinase 1 [Bacteroidaceae bacterium]|nr:polyphosphate kinase 1 [Bacteroidaceae bacterium]